MSFEVNITQNAAEVAAKVESFSQTMGAAIAAALDEQNDLTVSYIQRAKLSQRGPNTLGVIHNKLRPSVRANLAVVKGNVVDSSIGTNVIYAAVHEFGIDKDVQVRSFTRSDHRFDQHSVGKRGGRKLVAEGFVRVNAFTRHMRMPARAPIQTGIEERTANYTEAVSVAILAAWGNGGSTP